ncbi:hypothetical protein ARMGADRAFT_1070384 [Armillaria gallica]|uniref:Uncharacterized protein n=1 Tax=Armillaria gallica TaxID=47427 RepID=A0A2H3EU16_ARMGA|nr:hypothetical protein ARMGADRAFT_1070384 [Armillaria gallica]
MSTKGDDLHLKDHEIESENLIDYNIASESPGLTVGLNPHSTVSPMSTSILFNAESSD